LSVFFGGGWMDGCAAALSGLVLFATLQFSASLKLNSIIQTMICSAITALAVLLLVRLGIGRQPDKIMIGNIMLVIPGIQFTTALRDMINGDTISGLLNMSEAVLKAISVAMGFAVVLIVGGG
ncbi:MAG TPA: threonine/serine exporter family protein, partial [Candidatus Enterocloster excrementigallinarum]|nr:threonine/serine exporter family protein [Candidatus Enterocloster excrementigallinarum]